MLQLKFYQYKPALIKKILMLMLVSLNYAFLFGQEKAVLKGRVLEANSKKPLEKASLIIRKKLDNNFIVSGLSTFDGGFSISGIPLNDSIVIEISYAGYESFRGLFILRKNVIVLNDIFLYPISKELDTVLVNARARLVILNKDTIEFNAASFKMPPNAMANELLKRIPGLTIDEHGQLVFNGRPVSRVLVDGKEFFGSDGRIALYNIPVDLIKKVQINLDSPAGYEGGTLSDKKTQTLNLQLKEGNKYFGNGIISGGTDQHYNISGIVNLSKSRERINLLGGSNNINATGILPFSGSGGLSFTNENGVTRSLISGLSYGRDFEKETTVNIRYDYIHPVNNQELIRQRRQTLFPDSTILSFSTQENRNKTNSHSFNVSFSRKKNIIIKISMADIESENSSGTQAKTSDQLNYLHNNLESINNTKSKQASWGIGSYYTIPLNDKGRNLLLEAGVSTQQQKNNDINNIFINFYYKNLPDSQSLTRQEVLGNIKSYFYNGSLQYTEPISNRLQWKAFHKFSLQKISSDKIAWQLDDWGNRTVIDSFYSNSFTSSILTNNIGSGFKYKSECFEGNILVGVLNNLLTNFDHTRLERIKNYQISWVPEINIVIGRNLAKESLSMSINAYTTNPTKEQLQPVVDNTNPLFIKEGNANLRSSVNYYAGLTYNKLLSIHSGSSITGSFSFAPVFDKIIPAMKYDSLGRLLMNFVNINGTWTVSGSVSGNTRIQSGKDNFLVSGRLLTFYVHDRLYLDGLLSDVNTLSVSPFLSVKYFHSEWINISMDYSPFYNQLRYKKNLFQKRNYWSHNLTTSMGIFAFDRLKFINNISFRYNDNLPADFKRSTCFWNMELSWLCFKDKKGGLSFTIYDLLKQNRNFRRISRDNYIEDSEANGLQQYFMLAFTWQFSKLTNVKVIQK